MSSPTSTVHLKRRSSSLKLAALGALGVVYGDIGTSPIYALKDCFSGQYGVPLTPDNIIGVLSLVFWAISWIVVFKYLVVLMRADNNGEGGIMALIALLTRPRRFQKKRNRMESGVVLLGLFGAALLYGDGMITPAVSVLSSIEGLEIATPLFKPYIVPITILILLGLFLVQKKGTQKMGAVFGPLMLVWFIAIGLVALPWLIHCPRVFWALNPWNGVLFFLHNGLRGTLVLTAVVLCVTGAEALYADMGHFGASPIRFAWYTVVYPSLILNYFGQGALLMTEGEKALAHPFYSLVPQAFLLPMVAIAACATVIASQALISGVFSITQQAILLGFLPRLRVIHTSRHSEGQIFVPILNSFLMVSCIALVLAFRSSDRLTGAYGIAVAGTMLITSLLFYRVSRDRWKWPVLYSVGLTTLFLIVDTMLLIPNLSKIAHGGWVPIIIAVGIFVLMTTWSKGERFISNDLFKRAIPIRKFIEQIGHAKPYRVPGTAVFLSPHSKLAPGVLLYHFKHNQVLHEKVILLVLVSEHRPIAPPKEQLRIVPLDQNIFEIEVQFGFRQVPNLRKILESSRQLGLETHSTQISFFLGKETLHINGPSPMAKWRKRLFAFVSRNSQPMVDFLDVDPNWVIEVGAPIEL